MYCLRPYLYHAARHLTYKVIVHFEVREKGVFVYGGELYNSRMQLKGYWFHEQMPRDVRVAMEKHVEMNEDSWRETSL